MEMEQNQTPEEQEKITLRDISDEELLQMYENNLSSYEHTAEFIKKIYEIPTSRQAVYKRLKNYVTKKVENKVALKNRAETVLLQILNNSGDVKTQIAAAKVLLKC